jgi:O-antigen/teichoic acid export membrane protein
MSVLVLKFLFVFFAAKYWSPEQLGQYGFIATVVAYCGYIIGLDFYVNTQRCFLDVAPCIRNETMTHHFSLVVSAFILLVPCLVLYFGDQFQTYTIILICLLILFEQANAEMSRLLVLKNQQLLVSCLLFLRHGGFSATFVIGVFFEFVLNVSDILQLWLIFSCFSACLSCWQLRKLVTFEIALRRINIKPLKRQLKTAMVFFVGTIILRSLFSFDKFLVGELISLDMLGVYTFYIGLSAAIIALYDAAIGVYILPAIFHYKDEFVAGNLCLYMRKTCFQCFAVYSLAFTAFFFFGEYVIDLIGNKLYAEHQYIFIFVLVSAFFYSLSTVYNNVIYVFGGYDKWLTFISFISFVIFIFMSYLAVEQFAIVAILVASNLAFMIFFLLKYFLAINIINQQQKISV